MTLSGKHNANIDAATSASTIPPNTYIQSNRKSKAMAALTYDSQVLDGRAPLVLAGSKHAAPRWQPNHLPQEVSQLSDALRGLLAVSTQVKHLRSNMTVD
jgi:hypothetical protein